MIGHLPTIHIFKIAMLNKKFQSLILTLFKPLKFEHFKKFYELMQGVEMLKSNPDFSKYNNLQRLDAKTNAGNLLIIDGFMSGYDSETFGGSILRPLDNKQNIIY